MRDPADRGPWYRDGLRFRCQPDCGRCCVNHGDHTYLYLEGDDAPRLAAFLGVPLAAFLDRHTVVDDGLVCLRSTGDRCPFLDGTRCSVHPARPVQCRTFPFWRDHLDSAAAWASVGEHCPGVDRGDVHDLVQIEENLAARRLG